MANDFVLRIFDVEHGACAIMAAPNARIAMIDCGHNSKTGWRPSTYIRNELGLSTLHYLLVTNADRDHLSDMAGLRTNGVQVGALIRNGSPHASALRILKEAEGTPCEGVEAFLQMHATAYGYCVPFNDAMGGVKLTTFCNQFGLKYPQFTDTNNLSMVTFIQYAGAKFLFPGDLEKAGWHALLQDARFRAELKYTDVLVASHHGRQNGFCDEAFGEGLLKPQMVVISDTGIEYESQETVPDYRDVVSGDGLPVWCAGESRKRRVLTTRSDGDVVFRITDTGLIYTLTMKNKYSKKVA